MARHAFRRNFRCDSALPREIVAALASLCGGKFAPRKRPEHPQQFRSVERLGKMAVTFDARGLPFVKSLEGAHHQNHRHTGTFRIRLKALADLDRKRTRLHSS